MNTSSIQSHMGFRIEELPSGDGAMTLKLHGQLDTEAAPTLAADLDSRLAHGVRHVTIDFSRVDFISSSGVGSLVVSVSAFRAEGGDLLLRGVSDSVLHIFEMLGLLDFLSLE